MSDFSSRHARGHTKCQGFCTAVPMTNPFGVTTYGHPIVVCLSELVLDTQSFYVSPSLFEGCKKINSIYASTCDRMVKRTNVLAFRMLYDPIYSNSTPCGLEVPHPGCKLTDAWIHSKLDALARLLDCPPASAIVDFSCVSKCAPLAVCVPLPLKLLG